MTPQEVFEHVKAQEGWSTENKLAINDMYLTYLSCIFSLVPEDSDLGKRNVEFAEEHRKQLLTFGLKV